jgi:methylated-DNA-[protein]-cysteine S-methyltransferase
MGMLQFRLERFLTRVDEVLLVTDERGRVRALDFGDYEERLLRLLRLHYGVDAVALVEQHAAPPAKTAARLALESYFVGDLHALDALVVETGGTVFQRQVWSELRKIPVGQTLSYGQLAQHIGRPTAVRAVGLANGANPVGIVVPCHRVIGANTSLTGYAGGLHRKHWLLQHEGALKRKAPRSVKRQPRKPSAQKPTVDWVWGAVSEDPPKI